MGQSRACLELFVCRVPLPREGKWVVIRTPESRVVMSTSTNRVIREREKNMDADYWVAMVTQSDNSNNNSK